MLSYNLNCLFYTEDNVYLTIPETGASNYRGQIMRLSRQPSEFMKSSRMNLINL